MIELIIKKKYITNNNDNVVNNDNDNIVIDNSNEIYEYAYTDIINFQNLFLKYKNIILLITLLFFIFIKYT